MKRKWCSTCHGKNARKLTVNLSVIVADTEGHGHGEKSPLGRYGVGCRVLHNGCNAVMPAACGYVRVLLIIIFQNGTTHCFGNLLHSEMKRTLNFRLRLRVGFELYAMHFIESKSCSNAAMK